MKQIILKDTSFEAIDIDRKNILLNTYLSVIKKNNVSKYLEAIISIITKSDKDVISDISDVSSIDTYSLEKIYNEFSKIENTGRKIKLVVSECKPRIKFSIGNPITKLDMYLSTDEAIDGLKI